MTAVQGSQRRLSAVCLCAALLSGSLEPSMNVIFVSPEHITEVLSREKYKEMMHATRWASVMLAVI